MVADFRLAAHTFSVTAWNLTKWHMPYYESGDGTDTGDFKRKDSFSSNLFRHLVFGADLVSSPNWYLGIGYNYKTRTDMSTYSRSFVSGFRLRAASASRPSEWASPLRSRTRVPPP